MAENILLLDIAYVNDKSASLIKDFVDGHSRIKIISFSQPVLEKIKPLFNDEIKAVWSQDLFTSEDFEDIDRAAYEIIRGWYKADNIPLLKEVLRYEGIDLGVAAEYSLSLVLPQLFKKLKLVRALVLREKPQKIMVISQDDTLGVIVETIRKTYRYSLDTQFVTLGKRKSFTKLKIRIRNNLQFLIKPMKIAAVWFINKTFQMKKKNAGETKKTVVLFKSAKKLAEILDPEEFYVVLMDEAPDKRGLRLNMKKGVPYYLTRGIFKIHDHRKRSTLKKKIGSLWNSLKYDDLFMQIFTFEGTNFWTLIEKKIDEIITGIFPEQIRFIDAVYQMLKKTKPSLIISAPSITPSERIIFEIANILNIPTVDIQHGLMGDKRGREVVHSHYILVWGEGTKRNLIKWGNNPDSIFVIGNPYFEENLRSNNFISREQLSNRLKLDFNQGIFVFATGVYFIDSLPFFSSMWTRDEGEIVFRAILKALEEFSQKQLVVKIHPMENEQGYINIMDEFPHLANHVHIVKKTNLYSLLKESELLLTVGSTIDLEAMFFNKPIIVINLANNTVPLFIPSSRYRASVEIHKEDELVPSVKSILFNGSVKQRMREGQGKFICDFAGPLDGKNRRRISSALQWIIQESMRTELDGTNVGNDVKEKKHAGKILSLHI